MNKDGDFNRKALISSRHLLKKFEGKGGWTYAELPGVPMNKNNPFGWVRVSGKIDDFRLEKYKLMPMGNGRLFLPVKSAIRKKIKKEAGDYVDIHLSLDERPEGIPEELIACFENEPKIVRKRFDALPDRIRNKYLDQIFDARTDEEKTEEIIKLLQILTEQ